MVPFIFAGLGIVAVVLFNNLQADPVSARIISGSAVDIGDGRVEVLISWTDRVPLERTARIRIGSELLENETIPIWLGPDGEPLLDDPSYHLTPLDYVLGAALGGLLGLVVVLSVRGYGYVRGTGAPGEMTATEVREDRGFYWRT
ncbi:MAG: hypothetical protein OEM39_07165 [Acidimicrobiia bacterium]|nr:hypothetical protein [Acidimicrobiia bacterium]